MSKGRIWSKLSTPSTAFFKAAPGGSPTRRNKVYRPSASYVVAQVLPGRLLQHKLLTAQALYSSRLLTAAGSLQQPALYSTSSLQHQLFTAPALYSNQLFTAPALDSNQLFKAAKEQFQKNRPISCRQSHAQYALRYPHPYLIGATAQYALRDRFPLKMNPNQNFNIAHNA